MKNNHFFINYIIVCLFKIIFFQKIIKAEINTTTCNRTHPIYKSGICKLTYCEEEKYKSGECSINNDIIKTQYLTNIIKVGKEYFRYITFASYSNGDMILLTTAYPNQNERRFYGLKKNGRPLFINKINNKNNYFYSLEFNKKEEDGEDSKYESESLVIKLNKNKTNETGEINQKEYLISIAKKSSEKKKFLC